MHLIVFSLFVLGLFATDRPSKLAMTSYAAIYFACTAVFSLFNYSYSMTFDSYLLLMSTASLAQLYVYGLLPARGGIIIAAACEVLLISSYVVAYFRLPDFLAHRVAIWQAINFVAVTSLFMDWWTNGLPRLAAIDKWIRSPGAAFAATECWHISACHQSAITDKKYEEKDQ